MLNAEVVITAYKFVSPLSRKEARERLGVLKRYLLPFEKELSKETFREIFLSLFGKEVEEVEVQKGLFIFLYNYLLRKAKGEELLKEDEEYEIVKQYEHLVKHFPNIDPKHYRGDVLKFFRGGSS
ncbi:hypothetical protein Hydth_0535 [Hydrogenobacter thermophilus TK-6]|uniref:Uncharacterized protein n=1 Tax=Hydrogenobacter thermophilus (strain DSM 6534 / IAM 12695 / TK-6) TaxID=608538 RepID=D3DGP8_HYDTT|nr:hypothetical protein [Hydrogenobacter thermophilus]ADO44935.1 hypothetical protein Hydth_0535 [Hydrogenobacter thermophilus TK-6]BAI69000.1 hypothetical protein HTH_0537 [Hydrogenobacter thermophilus TK-6]